MEKTRIIRSGKEVDAYDYRMHIGHLKKEMNNVILIYGLCDMVHRAMTLVKFLLQISEKSIMMCFTDATAEAERLRMLIS